MDGSKLGHACRICYEPGNLISVCKCAGTIEYVHFECLAKWIAVSGRTTCELCGSEYTVFSEHIQCALSDISLACVSIMSSCVIFGFIAYLFLNPDI